MLPFFEDAAAASRIAVNDLAKQDTELREVYERIRALDPEGHRFASVLRDTIDMLLNGEVTGRYDWKTLFKTEKTHAGTLVEINLQREFKFDDGLDMDYQIAGVDVDCKYPQQFGGWMIPPEAMGHLCLLVWADDYKSRWSARLLRGQREWLNAGNNRDMKLTVKADHRDKIWWLWEDAELPENVLLHMDDMDREAVFCLNVWPATSERAVQTITEAAYRPERGTHRGTAEGLHEARTRQRRLTVRPPKRGNYHHGRLQVEIVLQKSFSIPRGKIQREARRSLLII
ncbi:NaeI family type II restriction endonuclease [Streptomyces sp. NPDC001939]